MKIKFDSLFFYSFIWILLFLSGNYIGYEFKFLFIFLSFVIILNFIHFIISLKSVRYNQKFSTEHPKKGDTISYDFYLTNWIPFISSLFEIIFHDSIKESRLKLSLKPFEEFKLNKKFSLNYKGIYEVGYKAIYCRDLLGIVSISLPIWSRTFYVYPRINNQFITENHGKGYSNCKNFNSHDIEKDYLDSIDKFRDGTSLSSISWKHFASRGEPFIKKFLSQESSNINIFVDKTAINSRRALAAEDMTIEVVISLIHYSLINNKKVRVSDWKYELSNLEDFDKYYKNTILNSFKETENCTLTQFKSSYKYDDNIIVVTPMVSSLFTDKELLLHYKNLELFIVTNGLSNQRLSGIKNSFDKIRKTMSLTWVK